VSAQRCRFVFASLVVAAGWIGFSSSMLCWQACAQASPSEQQLKENALAVLPKFAVATVKRARGNGMSLLQLMPDGIRIENFTLREILRAAFGM
jgi:hypothetical protein